MKKTYILLLALSIFSLGFSQTNLVLNGTFDDATDLTFDTEWTISGGTANFDDTAENKVLTFALSDNIVVGETYNLTFDVVSTNLGDARIEIFAGTRFDEQMNAPTLNYGVGTVSFYYTHLVADRTILTFSAKNSAGGGEFSIDNVVFENIIKTLVTVDRANIIGPTATGNDISIASTGFVRGSGIAQSNLGNANFSSNSWNATSQSQAATNNEYIEWTVSASASNTVEITEFDIRNRRNASGPENWQVFYSLDNFATAGIAAIPMQASTTGANNYNFNGLSIVSGTLGTITFRLYAWNTTNSGGIFRITGQTAWSAYGIANPGLRLIGTITGTAIYDTESNIVATSFDPSDNIDYSAYTAVSGLTTANAIKIGEFSIQDGGNDLTDADLEDTILTDLEFGITNSANLAALAIFDGVTNISETTVASGTVAFSGITGLTATDNSSKTFDVYATFDTAVTDNEQIQLTIIAAESNLILGSGFSSINAGGAQTPIVGDDNRIEVTATKLVFDQQPTDVSQFETMTPFPTVLSLDANDNLELDYIDDVTVISSDGDLDPSAIAYSFIDGVATLNTLVFTERGVVAFLIASHGTLPSPISVTFNVNGPLITIAQQDFDGTTPEWTYTTNVPTFDNGWGTDGYFDVIDSGIASPLDSASFSNNIFGENDINDEGDNGSTTFGVITFDTIDTSSFDDVVLSFDWDIHGYSNTNGLVQYRLIEDGVAQTYVTLLAGSTAIPTDQGTVSVTIPSSINSIALEVRIRNRNDIDGFSGFDNFKLSTVFDGLIHIDDGSSVGWQPSAPDHTTGSENAYVYSGTYNIGTNIEINNFIIRNGATTTVSPGVTLETNSLLLNNGTLELNSVSTSYSSLLTDNIIGEVIYNRHVNQVADTGSTTGNNDLISAPVTNASQTYGVLRAANPVPENLSGGITQYLFGPYSNISHTYPVSNDIANDADIVTSGVGYRTASTVLTGSTFEFVGNVETGTKNVAISQGAGSIQNLIGNPYPSYIQLSTFLATNTDAFSESNYGVYGYPGNVTEGFTVWNLGYSAVNPNAKITPGQGFFVASKTASETISFTPAMRTAGTTDDFIANRSTNNDLANLTLQVSKGSLTYKTDLYFNNNASLSMDPGYDSEMFESVTPDFAIYSQLVEDNLGKNMAAQSVAFTDLENVTIPLGINVAQGEQAIVSIAESYIPEGTNVILEDNVNNSFTNLQEGEYTFTPGTSLTETGRFFLHFSTESTLSDTDNLLNGLQIYTQLETIVIKGQLDGATTFNLFDVQGRKVNSQLLDSKNTAHSINTSNFAAGIYVVQLQNNSGSRTQKVIIR